MRRRPRSTRRPNSDWGKGPFVTTVRTWPPFGRVDAPRRWARAEWGALYLAVQGPVVERRWRAVPMTVGAACLTGFVQVVQNLGVVKAEAPLWPALLRTPLSLFVPALDLPVWGALAQILLVFGIAEICLGWWRTLLIAYAAALAGTLYARVGIALGPDHPIGLPASDAQVVDTGPSAAVLCAGRALRQWRSRTRSSSGAPPIQS